MLVRIAWYTNINTMDATQTSTLCYQLIVTNHLSSWRFLCANFTGARLLGRNIDIRFIACITYIFNAQAAAPFPSRIYYLRGLAHSTTARRNPRR